MRYSRPGKISPDPARRPKSYSWNTNPVAWKFQKNPGKGPLHSSSKSYYAISTGLSGVHFEWAFHGRPRSSFGVELHFEKGNKEQNQAMILVCSQGKDRLERQLGGTVVVQEEWGKLWSRLYVEKQEGKMTDALREWAVETMVKLIQLLQPELDKIKGI